MLAKTAGYLTISLYVYRQRPSTQLYAMLQLRVAMICPSLLPPYHLSMVRVIYWRVSESIFPSDSFMLVPFSF